MLGGDIVMAKVLKLLIIGLTLLIIVGCNNNEPEGLNDSNASEDVTTGEDESDFEDEGEDEESSDASEDESTSEGSEDDYDLLSLGETGLMETAIGDFEVTVTRFSFVDQAEESDPYQHPDNGIFVLVDVDLKNVGEEELLSSDIARARLYNNTGAGIAGSTNFPSIEQFPENIEPGETVSGQIIIDHFTEDYYELSFGGNHLESLTNEIRWTLNAEDAH